MLQRTLGDKTPTVLIKDFDREIQDLFRIKQRCDLKGLRDVITRTTESISEFNDIRDTSLVNVNDEKEFDDLLNQYDQILLELERCECSSEYKGKYKR